MSRSCLVGVAFVTLAAVASASAASGRLAEEAGGADARFAIPEGELAQFRSDRAEGAELPELDSEQIDLGRLAREKFGFDEVLDMRVLMETASSQEWVALTGIPMSDSEAAELFDRLRSQQAAGQMFDSLPAAAKDSFVVEFIDHQDGGTHRWQFLSVDPDLQTHLRAVSPGPERVVVEEVAFSADQIHGAVEALTRSIPSFADDGLVVTMVADDFTRNGVFVGIDGEVTEAVRDVLAAGLPAGMPLRIETADIDARAADQITRGGSGMIFVNSPPTGQCSVGPWAVDWIVPMLITAGHCQAVCDPVESPAPPGAVYNRVKRVDAGSVDAQSMVTTDPQLYLDVTNRAFEAGLEWPLVNVVAYHGVGDSVNDFACKAGAYLGSNWCGLITSVNASCYGHFALRTADYTGVPGDSGGPVFAWYYPSSNSSLQGVHNGLCPNGDSRYSYHTNVLAALGLDAWVLS